MPPFRRPTLSHSNNFKREIYKLNAVAKPARQFGHAMLIYFCVYKPYKESISKEMKNDLNFHSMTKQSGWLYVIYKIIYTGRHFVNINIYAPCARTNHAAFRFLCLIYRPIRRKSQNLSFYMRSGKEGPSTCNCAPDQ